VVAENMGRASGFGVTFGSQTSIGLAADSLFRLGLPERKIHSRNRFRRKNHRLTALSEVGSGSDALGAKCNAKLLEDGTHYILNGEKMWITNGSFSDMYIVFAKVDGEKKKFSAFVVERSETCRPGAEEHKMGIKSSSTTPLILSDCQVPVENFNRRSRRRRENRFQYSERRTL
jgi:alkylation response protein AidB-like acyl-CoA dehydrogenase